MQMKHTSPLVSIIVSVYNGERYLGELCESLLCQSYPNVEVLFLDDGSTDGTLRVLDKWAKDSRVRVFHWTNNRGVNAATLALLNRMQGVYWCNPGADDVLEPEFIERRLERMEANPHAVMVHGPGRFIDENGNTIAAPYRCLESIPSEMEGGSALQVLLQHNIINAPSIMARTDLTRLVSQHLFTGWQYADWFLCMLLVGTGFDLLWDERRLHRYRIHRGSLTFSESKHVVRRSNDRLVPLVALSKAATLSPAALRLWCEWRDALYSLWILRALSMQTHGILEKGWHLLASQAYYGSAKRTPLAAEVLKHMPSIAWAFKQERCARKRQSFPCAGLAQINHPLFS